MTEATTRPTVPRRQWSDVMASLVKEAKARGWRPCSLDVINEGFDVYIGLGGAAAKLSWYKAKLMPGLLQTLDDARTLIHIGNPGVDDDEIDRRVQLRSARQSPLTRVADPPALHVVLNEAVVRGPRATARWFKSARSNAQNKLRRGCLHQRRACDAPQTRGRFVSSGVPKRGRS